MQLINIVMNAGPTGRDKIAQSAESNLIKTNNLFSPDDKKFFPLFAPAFRLPRLEFTHILHVSQLRLTLEKLGRAYSCYLNNCKFTNCRMCKNMYINKITLM